MRCARIAGFFLVAAAIIWPFSAPAQEVSVDVNGEGADGSGVPGQTIPVVVRYDNQGVSVASIDMTLEYDPSLYSNVDLSDCPGPFLAPPLSSCTNDPGVGIITINIAPDGGASDLSNLTTLGTIDFTIDSGAPPGQVDALNLAASFFDGSGVSVPGTANDGTLTIEEPPQVTLGDVSGVPGDSVDVPIDYAASGDVVFFGIAFTFDPALYSNIDLSECDAPNASPPVNCGMLGSNEIFVVVGSTALTTPISSQRIGTIGFTIDSSTAGGQTDIFQIGDTEFFDTGGLLTPGNVVEGSIQILRDSDSDGIPDGSDNCPFTANPGQRDADGDGAGDACDGDADDDGIPTSVDPCPQDPENRCSLIGTVEDDVLLCEDDTPTPVEFSADVPMMTAKHVAAAAPVQAATTADFDRDGHRDVAMLLAGSKDNGSAIQVRLGDGRGEYAAGPRTKFNGHPTAMVSADFNADGLPDLAIADRTSGDVALLINAGGGHFASELRLPTGPEPVAIKAMDLDGDGFPGLVAANAGSGDLSSLVNTEGSFAPEKRFGRGTAPIALADADLNGDGEADLVVTGDRAKGVAVMFGDGQGGFRGQRRLRAAGSGLRVAPADFDRDGDMDLAVAGTGAVVLENDGNGRFRAGMRLAAGTSFQAVTTADLRGDGNPDLLLGSRESSAVRMFVNNGSGRFTDAGTLDAKGRVHSLATERADDGSLDDVLVLHEAASKVSLFLGNRPGNSSQKAVFDVGNDPADVAVLDVDRDGDRDLAVVNGGSGSISVLINEGDGQFTLGPEIPVGVMPAAIVASDLDGDGMTDLAVANRGDDQVAVLPGNGRGGFDDVRRFPLGGTPRSLAAADFDGDGLADLAVVTEEDSASKGSAVWLLYNDGAGGFMEPSEAPSLQQPELGKQGVARSIAAADFDLDGDPDLAVPRMSDDDVLLLMNRGDREFSRGASVAVGDAPVAVAVIRFNSDSAPDLAVANSGSNDISVLVNSTRSGFVNEIRLGFGTSPRAIRVADMDGDELDDIVVAGGDDSGRAAVFINDGTGTFTRGNALRTGIDPSSLVLADFNADGAIDLGIANRGSGNVSVLLNDGTLGAIGGATVNCVSADANRVVADDPATPGTFEGPDCTLIEPGLYEVVYDLVDDANTSGEQPLVTILVRDNFTNEIIDTRDMLGRIIPVNDAPRFTPGGDVTARAGSNRHVDEGWATNITTGAFNESGQGLNFELVPDDPTLFTEEGQPAVDPVTGTLSFVPRDGASGETDVLVSLKDNGPVGNVNGCTGNENSSMPATFTVTIVEQQTSLQLDAEPFPGGFDEDELLAQFNVGNPGAFEAADLVFVATVPPEVELQGGFNLAPGCQSTGTGGGSNDLRCDASGIPDWQCAIDGPILRCTLERLPPGGNAPLVVRASATGPGPFTIGGEVSAINADPANAELTLED